MLFLPRPVPIKLYPPTHFVQVNLEAPFVAVVVDVDVVVTEVTHVDSVMSTAVMANALKVANLVLLYAL